MGCSKRNQLSVLLSGRGSTMMASLARGETPRSLDITMMGTRPYRAGGRKLNENDFKSINEHATQICKDWGYHMIYIYIYDVISGFAPSNQTWLAPLIKTSYRLECSTAKFDYQRVVFVFFFGQILNSMFDDRRVS